LGNDLGLLTLSNTILNKEGTLLYII